MIFIRNLLLNVLLVTTITGCGMFTKITTDTIPEGYYVMPAGQHFSSGQADTSISFPKAEKIFVFIERDTLWFTPVNENTIKLTNYYFLPPGKDYHAINLKQSSFDFDVFTTPYKFRPAVEGLPLQMNTTFNGSLYFGYRKDYYTIRVKEMPANISRTIYNKKGYGIGGFIGIGSAFINPTFMRNTIDYEYDGFVINYGTAVLVGYRKISTGIALGFDFLTDKNKDNWVYQNKPWLGIFIGLNLN